MAPAEPAVGAGEAERARAPVHRAVRIRRGLDADDRHPRRPRHRGDVAASPAIGRRRNPLRPSSFRRAATRPSRRANRRSWGWVIALLLVIAALVAVAILGTVLLTRDSEPKVSQEDKVRSTIQNFDIAIQNGDLATLRSITCGTTRTATSTTTTARGPKPMPGWRRPSSIRWSPASTRWWSTATTPRPTSRRSWPTPRRPGRRAASTWSSATTSGRSARRHGN